MENKRPLQDIPNEVLLSKLRRANGAMTKAISEEILCRTTFFKPGTENEILPSIVNVTLSDSDSPKIQYPDFSRIRCNRILMTFHFLTCNADRGIYPIEIRIPKDEFEELSTSEQEFVNAQMKEFWQVEYKWI